MIKNYLTIAFRNLYRHKLYAFISIGGLGVGMACAILTGLFVRHELSYDRFHPHSDRIYRVVREARVGDEQRFSVYLPGQLCPQLEQMFPEVEMAARLWASFGWVTHEEQSFYHYGYLVDASIFEMLNLPLLIGDPKHVLAENNSIVITEKLARKFFGQENPVGKQMTIDHIDTGSTYTITGVLKDLPGNTAFTFDFLHSFPQGGWIRGLWNGWQPGGYRYQVEGFVRLREGASADVIKKKVSDAVQEYLTDRDAAQTVFHLQPFAQMHLYSNVDYRIVTEGDIQQVYQFGAVGVFVLLIACINYVNLATAWSSTRVREVGMRKVVGAERWQLASQFLGESMLVCLIALFLGGGLAALLLPYFGALMERSLSFGSLDWIVFAVGGVIFWGGVGVLAGSYPAIFLSSFQPALVLKGGTTQSGTGRGLRRGLVVFQFAMSIVLIISTGVVQDQMNYIRTKKLGYDREHLVVMPIFMVDWYMRNRPNELLSNNHNAVKAAFLKHPNVLKTAAYRFSMGVQRSHLQGPLRRVIRSSGGQEVEMPLQQVDEDFLDTFGIELLAGRKFSIDIKSDNGRAYLLNEAAVQALGLSNPVGETVNQFSGQRFAPKTIIGVVKDFHLGSLHEQIGPMGVYMRLAQFRHLAVRIRPENVDETLAFLERTWKHFIPNRPFMYAFMEDRLDVVYKSEAKMGRLFDVFAIVGVIVACLGLFGLAAFTTGQRTKEVSIRKVLGARASDLVALLFRDTLALVLVANVVAWPVTYFATNAWLQNFAYRTHIGLESFVLGGFLALVIAFATVGYQAFKTVRSNPVDVLRNE